jgi:hypothetical protein
MNYSDLLRAPEEAYKHDPQKLLCAMPPHNSWIKKNRFANNAEYLPVDKIEYLLDCLFGQWKVEVLSATDNGTNCTVTIRLHFEKPDGQWSFHDGVASEPFKRDSISPAEKATFDQLLLLVESTPDLSKRAQVLQTYYDLKRSRPIKDDAVKGAYQIAKSYAIRDAADHLGKLFGRDLNRKDTVEFAPQQQPQASAQQPAPQPQPQPQPQAAAQQQPQASAQQQASESIPNTEFSLF